MNSNAPIRGFTQEIEDPVVEVKIRELGEHITNLIRVCVIDILHDRDCQIDSFIRDRNTIVKILSGLKIEI